MSESRSSTPTRKPSGASTNIATINDPRIGPTQPHDTITIHSVSSRTAQLVIAPATPRLPSPRSSPRRGVVRRAEDDLEEPMAKRQRRVSLEPPPQRHHEDSRSSPSSDSQSGMADTEVDQKKTGQSASSMGSTTQKKKRTRTLTTPHQAAVLHALLAKSRFPTTAMREEVGRAIGLSARKVQIWFQNQRQKARRPRSQGDAPPTHSPQRGSYPTSLQSPGVTAHPMPSHVRMQTNAPYNIAGPSTLRMSGGPPPVPTEGECLLGPGMPGVQVAVSRHRYTRSHGRDLPAMTPPTDVYFSTGPMARYGAPSRSTTSPSIRSAPMLRPIATQSSYRREWDLSRTLPPLIQSRPATSSHPSHHHSHRPYPTRGESPLPLMAPVHAQRTPSPERQFAHQPPELHSGLAATLPPPYTLQPTPHWNQTPHLADAPPRSGYWFRPVSRSGGPRSVTPHIGSQTLDDRRGPELNTHLRQAITDPGRMQQSYSPPLGRTLLEDNPPSSASGRYDPVREIFVPFTPTVESTMSARIPERNSEDNKVDHSSDEHQ